MLLAALCLSGAGLVLTGRGRSLLRRVGSSVYGAYKRQTAAQAAARQAAKSPPQRATEPLMVYRHALAAGWQDWSWAQHNLKSGAVAPRPVLSMVPAGDKGVYLHRDPPVLLGGYGTLELRVQGDAPLTVRLVAAGGQFGPPVTLQDYVRGGADGWALVEVPLRDLGVVPGGMADGGISGVVVQAVRAGDGDPGREIYLDAIGFGPDPALAPAPIVRTVAVSIEASQDRHPVSPFIYGMAFAPPEYVTDLNLGVNRWGGNDKSRYNWVHGNAVNAARDWNFANRRAVSEPVAPGPSGAADRFVRQNLTRGADTLLTVPALGWVARNADNGSVSTQVPARGDAPIGGRDGVIAGYDATLNRQRTSVPSYPRKGRPFEAAPKDGARVYQDEWIHHLTRTFGAARDGGVRFYAIDNEPDLWAATHTDVHPAQAGYDEVLERFLAYASAVKDIDPGAQITGPVSWGWTGYLYSALDAGQDNFRTHADRKRHGDVPFLLWFLQQVRRADTQSKRRSLDVLDVHFYPQNGLYNQAVEPEAQAKRLRSVRALWDADYPDESWIGEPVRLIPRLREWIAGGYAGTRIGITEWNWGADQHINGALCIAETLGVFGREDVYLANYWAYPLHNSPGYLAFKLLRRPSNVHADRMGDVSIRATSQNDYQVSGFAGLDTRQGQLTVLLINKMPGTTATVPVHVSGVQTGSRGRAYLLRATVADGRQAAITSETVRASSDAGGARLHVTMPPYSARLICLPLRGAPSGAQENHAKHIR